MRLPATAFRTFYLFILFISLVSSSKAQPYVDILKLQYRYFPEVAYTDYEDRFLKSSASSANLLLPVKLKHENIIMLGGNFRQIHLQLTGNDTMASSTLYNTALRAGGIKQWNDQWRTMLLAIPRIRSDYQELSGEHWQIAGIFLATYRHSEVLKYKFGLYYSREFFGNFFMPLLGVDWRASERLNIFGVIPGSMHIEYQLGERFYTGLAYRSVNGSYRLSDLSSEYYVREGDTFWAHNQLKAFFDYYPWKNIVLGTGIGVTSWRQYDLYDKNDNISNRTPVYQSFKDGLFLHVKMAYRVRMDRVEKSKK